jgi:hypothetical protein
MPAGTLTPADDVVVGIQIRQKVLAWISDASGNVDQLIGQMNGLIVGVSFVPDGGGTQPTDGYDVVINDVFGIDILSGQGANLSNVNKTSVCPLIPATDGTTTTAMLRPVADELTLLVTNAGNATGGKVIIYYK